MPTRSHVDKLGRATPGEGPLGTRGTRHYRSSTLEILRDAAPDVRHCVGATLRWKGKGAKEKPTDSGYPKRYSKTPK